MYTDAQAHACLCLTNAASHAAAIFPQRLRLWGWSLLVRD